MNMKKLILSGILSIGVLCGSVTPVLAEVNTSDASGSVGSNLTIDAKVTSVNVTIPTTAPFVFNEDGTNTVPSTFKVINNSEIGGVYLESVSLDSKLNGWKVVDSSFDLKTMPVNTKNIRLKVGKTGVMKLIQPTSSTANAAGSANFTSGEIDIEAKQEQLLNFEIERGAFSSAVSTSTAFDMTLQFKFQ